jgi:Asp-tRNA(Asn)/Glu-tRNA(Gln) amidotransferase A subunit family amidase
MTDLHYLLAAEALRLFRTRQLSPVELVTAVTERAEAVEPVLNAFAETFYEQALDQARASEARYAGRGGPVRPLDGLPGGGEGGGRDRRAAEHAGVAWHRPAHSL